MLPPGFHVIRLGTVGSTQDEARIRAQQGCPSGTLVRAEAQTSGRGRGAHAWASAAGMGIWLTLVHRSHRPEREWPALTSGAALAICHALEDLGLVPAIRWPNDVVLASRKIAGILAETEGDAVLLGVGVNVLHRAGDFPPDLRSTATSVLLESRRSGRGDPDPESVFDRLWVRLDVVLHGFESDGPGWIVSEVWERSVVRGRLVRVRIEGGEMIEGRATGLGRVGELEVEGRDRVTAVSAGALVGWGES